MKQAIVLVGILAMTVMAGCLDNGKAPHGVDSLGVVGADGLEAGNYYQFLHRGGSLRFSVADETYAVFDLFDGDDLRIGRIELGAGGFGHDLLIDGSRGQYVLGLLELTTTGEHEMESEQETETSSTATMEMEAGPLPEFHVESGGRDVSEFIPLGYHVERHVLVDRPIPGEMIPGLSLPPLLPTGSQGQPVDDVKTIELRRAPTELHLLAAGNANDLSVRIRGSGGILFEFDDSYEMPFPVLAMIRGNFYVENVRDNVVEVALSAAEQEGPILLEAYSYSRFLPEQGNARLSLEADPSDVTFTYGELPKTPVRVEVSSSAKFLYAWTQDMAPLDGEEQTMECEVGEPCSGSRMQSEPVVAWVAVYGPGDAKIGTFRVESGQRLAVPTTATGSYVVIALSGPVTIGTDVAPRDFEMHPMETKTTMIGSESPGSQDEYGRLEGDVNVTGVPYKVLLDYTVNENGNQPFVFLGPNCSGAGTVVLRAGGETIGVGGNGFNSMGGASMLLPPTGLSYVQDGFSGNCGQAVLLVSSYIR